MTLAALLAMVVPASARVISFTADIAPILQRRCVACHGAEKTKGHYRLDTFEALLKPGSSDKAPLVAGKAEASQLFHLLIAKSADDRMPQDADPLPASETASIREWIASGARFDGKSRTAPLASFLPAPSHPPAPKVYAHAWPVTALAFNVDGSQLVSSGYHEIIFWNATNGVLLRRMGGMPERIRSLAWQPRGDRLAVAGGAPGRSGELFLIDPSNKTTPPALVVSSDEILCATFSSDGLRIAAGGADKSVRVFAINTAREILKLEQHSDWIHGVVFSADGQWLASASRDRTARVYNSTNGVSVSTFREHGGAVESILFVDDGKVVLTAGSDRTVRAWDSNDAGHMRVFAKFETPITGLISAGTSVLIALADGHVTKLGFPEGKELTNYHHPGELITSVAFHKDSGHLAIGTDDGRVRVWDAETALRITQFIASPGLDKTAARK